MLKKKLYIATVIAIAISLFAIPSVASANTGLGSGSSGGGSTIATKGGYWAITSPYAGCQTPTLQKYYNNGTPWAATAYAYDATVNNSALVNQSIGSVNYSFNGQSYNSGNLPVSYGWIINQERGAWSWWSQRQAVKRNTGQVWINSLSTAGSANGQVIWACASNISTPVTSSSTTTHYCIVGVQQSIDGGAWTNIFTETGANSTLFGSCQTSWANNTVSPQSNSTHSIAERQIIRPITQTSYNIGIYVDGVLVTNQGNTTYSAGADTAQAVVSGNIYPTTIAASTTPLGYWYMDNQEAGGGHWVDINGNTIPASNTYRHNDTMIMGPLWDNNTPVLATWNMPQMLSTDQSMCTSVVTVPSKAPVTNPPGGTCIPSSSNITLSSQKIVNGNTINLLSFAPVSAPSNESFTWTLNTTQNYQSAVTDSRLIRSINSQPITVNASMNVNLSQPVSYGGTASFSFAVNNTTGAPTQSLTNIVYNTPYSYTYTASLSSKILGGVINTYSVNNDIN